jgi:hypothetical protein
METEKFETENRGLSKIHHEFVQKIKKPGPFIPSKFNISLTLSIIATCLANEIEMLSQSSSGSDSDSDSTSLVDTTKAASLIL